MKVATETQSSKEVWIKPAEFTLANGLIGFPDVTKFELLANTDELPFMWIRSVERHELGFIVIEPSEILDSYEVEIPDDDIESLGIQSESDTLVLNIVTIREGDSIESATVNLIGPILLNRHTMEGKQVVIQNNQKFSARHPIMAEVEEN